MYALIEACGKQYKVVEGETVFFEKLDSEEGKKVTFDKVILVSDENGKVQIGNPYVKDVKVEGKVISHGKAKKIIVFKMKPKKNERKKQGHRQPYTKVEITSIKTATTKTSTEKAETEKKPVAKKETATAKKVTSTEKKTTGTATKKNTTAKKEA